MADQKISQLSDGGNSQATDEYVIARSGANYRIDGASVAAAATSVGTLTSLTVSGATTLQSQTTMSRQAGAAVNLLFGLRSSVADIATDTAGTIRFLNAAQSSVNMSIADAGDVVIRNNLTVDTNTLYVDAANNRVGVGTASPAQRLDVAGNSVFGTHDGENFLNIERYASALPYAILRAGSTDQNVGVGFAFQYRDSNGTAQDGMFLNASGNLGLGVTPDAGAKMTVAGGILSTGAFSATTGSTAGFDYSGGSMRFFSMGTSGSTKGSYSWIAKGADNSSSTPMTLDASGNLGVGATSPSANYRLTVQGVGTAGNPLGGIAFRQGSTDVMYMGNIDLTNTTDFELWNPRNGYTRFGTNGVERARIRAEGDFLVGTTNYAPGENNVTGHSLQPDGLALHSKSGGYALLSNRKDNDGTLVSLRQDGNEEGTISVSGNTVSYNAFAGSHWSQLEDGSKPEILRGTVMEALNELCEWPNEQNERLPKAKVSDTAGSKKVYGVFMAWDNDWTVTNDMYVTAVGAFICRVAADVVVEQGDLLESNGDGTARVQADDVIRSSTIGKVTSTVKTHEYEDGTYCVPTVLYCG